MKGKELELIQLPAFNDNYLYLLHSPVGGQVAAVDPGDAEVIIESCDERGWQLTDIFTTHNHSDHTGGNLQLKQHYGCRVHGLASDAHRIPGIDVLLEDHQRFQWGSMEWEVLCVPGHTLGHIAYYLPDEGWLFCGDTLFLMGCGRLFEGSPQQMHQSLQRLASLPDETLVFCAHEYTETNGQFAETVEPTNEKLKLRMAEVRALRREGKPTVPVPMKLEKATNPFLRVGQSSIRQILNLQGADDVAVFAALRQRRNSF